MKETKQVKKNKVQIRLLQADYNKTISRAMGIKNPLLFLAKIDEANAMLLKIRDLRIKNYNLERGLPENGYAESDENYNFLCD